MEGFLVQKMPWDALWRFITHGFTIEPQCREVAFQWSSGAMKRNMTFSNAIEAHTYVEAHDAHLACCWQKSPGLWCAHMMFSHQDEWREFVLEKQPLALHIGAVYCNGRLGRRWEREHGLVRLPFVCDLDIDEVDRAICVVCPCKGDKCCCDVCWAQWVRPRLERILHVLVDALKLERILLVYSGRRGAHVWALDECAWGWTKQQRENVVRLIQNNGVTLDRGVSTELHHLCKMPLYPHAVTGIVAVPIPLSEWHTFVPSMAPHYSKVTPEQMQHYAKCVMTTCTLN